MVKLMAYLQLVRAPILVLIALLQLFTRHFLLEPMLAVNGFTLLVSPLFFYGIMTATILIAAGGYCINNYFDVKIDRVNKPRHVVVDRLVPRRVAMLLHIILSGVGLSIAFYICYTMGMWRLSALFTFAVIVLWFYSLSLKHQLLTGNLVIAILAGAVPLIVGLFEIPLQNTAHSDITAQLGYSIFNGPAYWILAYSAIIAALTLIREITKDVVDLRGDKQFGCNSLPVRFGIRVTKSVLLLLYAAFGAAVSWLWFQFPETHSLSMNSAVALVLFSVFSQFPIIFLAKTKRQFQYSTNLNNFTTITVLLSMWFVKLSIESYFV